MGIREETGNTLNAACLDLLARKGITAWRSNNHATYDRLTKRFRRFIGRKGVADILGVYEQEAKLWDGRVMVFGILLAIETKARGDRLSREQRLFGDDIRQAGGVYVCVRKIGDLVDAIAALERQNAEFVGPRRADA